jgi:hypothetical protein
MQKRTGLILAGGVLVSIAGAIAVIQLPSNWFKPDYLVDLSSVLELVSFTVRSMVALRLLALGAQLTFIPYCFLQPTPLWTPIVWNLLFMGVNIINLVILFLEKRPVVLNPDEQKLYNLAFKSLQPREFLKLTTLGEFQDIPAGERLVTAGQPASYISVLIDGKAEVLVNNKSMMELPEGLLLGIVSILAGEAQDFDIVTSTPGRYIRWPVGQLRNFLDKQPDLREKFQSLVNQDLVKVINSLESSLEGK